MGKKIKGLKGSIQKMKLSNRSSREGENQRKVDRTNNIRNIPRIQKKHSFQI